MTNFSSTELPHLLARIADALERLAPPAVIKADFDAAEAFIWQAAEKFLQPVPNITVAISA